MTEGLQVALLSFVGGLLGGGGLAGGLAFYFLKRRELAYQSRVAQMAVQKVAVYAKCAKFLRRLQSYQIVEAFDVWNDLADELLLWASADVYRQASSYLRRLAEDPSGRGLHFERDVAPILAAMVKDVNPGTTLRPEDVLPHARFIPQNPELLELHELAFAEPQKFNELGNTLKTNLALIEEIKRGRLGNFPEVVATFRRYLRPGEPIPEHIEHRPPSSI